MMRFYGYSAQELESAADPATGCLPLDIDPKLAWALRHRDCFPVDVNRAPRGALLRVPGLGVKAVDRIVARRRHRRPRPAEIGRAAGRERVGMYVLISVGAVHVKKNKTIS